MDNRLREASFEINASSGPPSESDARAALDVVRPGLLADRGNVELVSVEEDGTVRVELQGACERCPAREMTLRRVIEPRLKASLPWVTSVIAD